jgi:hypothetical protein
MTPNLIPDPLILEAVREKLAKVNVDLAEAEHDAERAEAVAAKAREKRLLIEAKRSALTKYLAQFGADDARASAPPASIQVRRMSFADEMVEKVSELLADGRRMKVEELHVALANAGFTIAAKNPLHRISQVLSLSKKFNADRVSGWSVKKRGIETPEGAAG